MGHSVKMGGNEELAKLLGISMEDAEKFAAEHTAQNIAAAVAGAFSDLKRAKAAGGEAKASILVSDIMQQRVHGVGTFAALLAAEMSEKGGDELRASILAEVAAVFDKSRLAAALTKVLGKFSAA